MKNEDNLELQSDLKDSTEELATKDGARTEGETFISRFKKLISSYFNESEGVIQNGNIPQDEEIEESTSKSTANDSVDKSIGKTTKKFMSKLISVSKKTYLDIKNSGKRVIVVITLLLIISVILLISTISLSAKLNQNNNGSSTTVSGTGAASEEATLADFGFNNMMGMNRLVKIHRYDLTAGTITIYPFEYGGRYSDLNATAEYATDLRYILLVFEDGYYYTDFVSYYGKPANNKKSASEYEIIDNTAISDGHSVMTIETDFDIEKNYIVVKDCSSSYEYYVSLDLIDWYSGDFDRDTRSITYEFK